MSTRLALNISARAAAVMLVAFGSVVAPAGVAAARVVPCTVTGTAGADVLVGTAGNDVLCGLGGDDVMSGGAGSDIFRGGDGNDTVSYTDHVGNVVAKLDGLRNDGVAGERDTIAADVENLIGGSGNDTLVGNNGVNALAGGPGVDTLMGRAGADSLDGGTGVDTVSYAGTAAAVDVSLDGVNNDGVTGENDAITAVENVLGGNGADVLTGNSSANVLTGGLGDDTLLGGGGADTLSGGFGNDTLDGQAGADTMLGGTGADTVTYAARSADLTVDMDNVADDGEAGEADNVRSDVETIMGGSGDDTLTGSGLANTLDGADGNDTLRGQGGKDTLRAGGGNDTVHYDTLDTVVDTGDGTDTCTRNRRPYACPSSGPTLTALLPSGGNSPGYDETYLAGLSADGRYGVLESDAPNWVAGDTNGSDDVFVRDNSTGAVTRVSVGTDGTQGNGNSSSAAISADGRYVAFMSYATNLVANDTNSFGDIFVRDTQNNTTTRVTGIAGAQPNGGSLGASLSADGRYVAIGTLATNMTADTDTGIDFDVVVHDRQTGTSTLASGAVGGGEANGGSLWPAISADGSFVAFDSEASNLVVGDTNGAYDVYRRDLSSGTTVRVSVTADGGEAGGLSRSASISADGRYVSFHSDASNLVTGDTNGARDVFRKDLQTGAVIRVSVAADGSEQSSWSGYAYMSTDGRHVAFGSNGATLVAGDSNASSDVFVKDLQTNAVTRVSVAADGTQDDGWPDVYAMSGNGSTIAITSYGDTTLAPDGNPDGDSRVYLWRR